LVDSAGSQYLKQNLPNEWVIREYRPDYGVDFDIEVFDYSNQSGDLVSLGEHVFVQLKSSQDLRVVQKIVHPRFNIEKQPLRSDTSMSSLIDVIPVRLDAAELLLAHSMGPALPVLLIVCDTGKSALYFLCLNDFVDKLLIPRDPLFRSRKSITVHVPTWNRVSLSTEDLIPIRFFARRSKLYAAFNRFRYQANELIYLLSDYDVLHLGDFQNSKSLSTILHFLQIVKSYDFWQTTWAWPALELAWLRVQQLDTQLHRLCSGEPPTSIINIGNEPYSPEGITEDRSSFLSESVLLGSIQATWSTLANLGNMFEEICREWYLPTHLGALAEATAIRPLGAQT
jgi:hypothetical protein